MEYMKKIQLIGFLIAVFFAVLLLLYVFLYLGYINNF